GAGPAVQVSVAVPDAAANTVRSAVGQQVAAAVSGVRRYAAGTAAVVGGVSGAVDRAAGGGVPAGLHCGACGAGDERVISSESYSLVPRLYDCGWICTAFHRLTGKWDGAYKFGQK